MGSPRTPPPAPIMTPDTVPRPRHTSGAEYRTGDLILGKTAVLKDLGSIPIVSLDYFQEAVLPPLPLQITTSSIKTSLINQNKLTREGKWAAFPNDPKDDSRREEHAFGPLASAFNSVIEEALKLVNSPSTLKFVQNPSTAPKSQRTNTSRPDAYLLMINKKSFEQHADVLNPRDSWDDIVVSFEYKKNDGKDDRIDNEQKLIWSLHHIMRSDPCRRSTFGVTIENTQARLWFTCRAVTLVSERFNFVKEVERVIHFFCALEFAEDHQRGWDPTIQRVLDEGHGVQYDITFSEAGGKTSVYRTTQILSDFGAEALRGRGTRVFEAYLMGGQEEGPKNETKRVAIKDAWRDCDRLREDKIMDAIFQDITAKGGASAATDARKYFLTVRHAEDVTISGITDDTLGLMLRGHVIPTDCEWHNLSPYKAPSQVSHSPSVGNTPHHAQRRPATSRESSRRIQHKIHCRVIFGEVCEPTSSLELLSAVFQTLCDGAAALQILHDAGWVHRDVSVGNVLRYEGRGKLSDLEYAKKVGSGLGHDVCTGTVNFMACEVEGQRYLFVQETTEISPEQVLVASASATIKKCPFRFNPLHDLESLWWIATWTLYYHTDVMTHDYPSCQQEAYDTLFPGVVSRLTRLTALQSNLNLDAVPPAFYKPGTAVEGMRRKLVSVYRQAKIQCERVEPDSLLAGLQQYYLEMLGVAWKASEGVKLVPPHVLKKRGVGALSQPTEDAETTPSRPNKRTKS